jgi:hypothetical protein
LNVTEAFRAPVTLGVKVTVTLHIPPTARLVTQVLLCV